MTSGASSRSDPAGADFWHLITAPETVEVQAPREGFESWARRLAYLVGPVLADFALGDLQAAVGRPVLDPESIRHGRLLNRFTRARQESCLATLREAGVEVVVLKGLALAHGLYPDPDIRVAESGDLDILLRGGDRDRTVAHLTERGYSFGRPPAKAWGFISTASYLPFMSLDGAVNLDLHVHPDAYPLHRSLTTERVFAAAKVVAAGPSEIRIPSPEHCFLLLASNAAKDKFGELAVKKALDAVVMLRSGWSLDWTEIESLAARGRLLGPLRVFLALLAALGLDMRSVPARLVVAPTGVPGREFRRMVADWRALFPAPMGAAGALRREFLLSAEPSVGLHNNWLRLKGLVWPASGLPPGWTRAASARSLKSIPAKTQK